MPLSTPRQEAQCQADQRVVASLDQHLLVWSRRIQDSSWSEVGEEDTGNREGVKDGRERRGKKRTYVRKRKEHMKKWAELEKELW